LCPFLKRYPISRDKYAYFCSAGSRIPFVKLEEKEVFRYCNENRYIDCKYYLRAQEENKKEREY